MSYTNVWSDASPLGSAAANTIDDIFRALKVDIEQRLSDLHGIADFTTDPLKTNYIRAGYGTSTKGGYVALTDDAGLLKWQVGLRSTAAAKSFVIYDIANNVDRLSINASTGLTTLSNGLALTAGGLTVTAGGLVVTAGGLTVSAGGFSLPGAGNNASFGGNISLTTDSAEVTTTFAGVTTSRFKTDVNGGLVSVDGANQLRFLTNSTTRLSISGVGVVAVVANATIGTGLSITAGGLTVVNGGMTVTGTYNQTGDIAASLAASDNQLSLNSVGGSGRQYAMIAKTSGNFVIRDITGGTDRFTIVAGGVVQVAASLTVGTGLTVSAGGATVSGTIHGSGAIIADSTLSAGTTITAGTGLTVTSGGITITAGGFNIVAGGMTVSGAATFSTSILVPTFIAFGTNPATTGFIRLPNASGILFRNSANSGNVNVITLDASDIIQIASNTNITGTLTVSGAITGALTGNASTATLAAAATVLQTARTINGTSFNGSANITVAAAAGTLTGATLAAGVTASSLTSVGTLTALTVAGDVTLQKHIVGSSTPTLSNQLAGSVPTIIGSDTMMTVTFTVPVGGITIGTRICTVTFDNPFITNAPIGGSFGSTAAGGPAAGASSITTASFDVFPAATYSSGIAGNSYSTNFIFIGR